MHSFKIKLTKKEIAMSNIFELSLPSGEILKGVEYLAKDAKYNLTIQTGMCEHATRYEEAAKYLNQYGINVFVVDAFGQGLNAESIERQQIWPVDGFSKNVDGIALMVDKAKENGLPTTHFGHSMGSFMTQSFMERYPGKANKIILCGSNGGQRMLMKLASFLANIIVNKKNFEKPVPFIQKLSLDAYSKSIKNRKGPNDWLSYDEENIAAYEKDPYCGALNTGSFWKYFLKGMSKIWDKKEMKQIDKDTHIFIIAGKEDPVGQNGVGPIWLYETYKKLGIKNVSMRLYDHMRHEIFCETEKEMVFKDVANFVTK